MRDPLPPAAEDANPAGTLEARRDGGMSSGIRWGLVDRVAQIVVRLASMLLLARLLLPRDFGLVGFATIVTDFALRASTS